MDAYVPILLSEVKQEQRPSLNGDREAILVGAGNCDGEGECRVFIHTICPTFQFLDLISLDLRQWILGCRALRILCEGCTVCRI